MRKILVLIFILNTLLLASTQSDNKSILDKHIEEQLKKEKKYAKEQVFYSEDNYDFKGAEVNPDSLKNIKDIEPEYDFDMNDVYD